MGRPEARWANLVWPKKNQVYFWANFLGPIRPNKCGLMGRPISPAHF